MAPEHVWERMVQLYALPGVANQCLALQRHSGVSVTALLTLLVLAAQGHGAVRPPVAARMAAISEAYQAAILRPLRKIRDELEGYRNGTHARQVEALRDGLLDRELDAERLEQLQVLDLLAPPESRLQSADPLADACASVARYMLALGATPESECRQALCHLVAAAVEDYDGLQIIRAMDQALRGA